MMPAKRTILVNHLLEPPNRITGITRYLFALLASLNRSSRYRYVLVTTWDEERLPDVLRDPSVDVVTRPFHESTPKNVACQMMTIPRLMRESGASLEFNCNPLGGFRASWPRVITVHDLYFDLLPEHYRLRHRLWWRWLFPRSLAAASAIICVSHNTQADLQRHYAGFGGRSVVVQEAGTLNSTTANGTAWAGGGSYALYVGNVSANKNPQVLVDAMKRLEAGGGPVNVRHVGEDRAGLLADAQSRAGLSHPVQRAGVVSDDELADAYRHATCLVNTSRYEGFCLPILEAQTFGAPVICADIPVLREVAGDAALFFAPDDADALAGLLRRVFAEQDLSRRLSEASVRNAARFSWARAAAETEAVFDRAIEVA